MKKTKKKNVFNKKKEKILWKPEIYKKNYMKAEKAKKSINEKIELNI